MLYGEPGAAAILAVNNVTDTDFDAVMDRLTPSVRRAVLEAMYPPSDPQPDVERPLALHVLGSKIIRGCVKLVYLCVLAVAVILGFAALCIFKSCVWIVQRISYQPYDKVIGRLTKGAPK